MCEGKEPDMGSLDSVIGGADCEKRSDDAGQEKIADEILSAERNVTA